jgi:hypothetical protein
MHLKYSKGSRHSSHFQDALHAVEPNSLTKDVFVVPQRGQLTDFVPPSSAILLALPAGGAMP